MVDVEQSAAHPGAAANTAANLSALGVPTELVTMVGDDEVAAALLQGLHRHGVTTDHVLTAPGRTACKSRVVAEERVLVRFDQEADHAAGAREYRRLAERLTEALLAADALVICDYGAGIAHPSILAAVAECTGGSCAPGRRQPRPDPLAVAAPRPRDAQRGGGAGPAVPAKPRSTLALVKRGPTSLPGIGTS